MDLWKTAAFWDVAPCSLFEVDQRFRGAYCPPSSDVSPWWWRQYASLKRRSALTRLHRTISQKAVIFILAASRTWNLMWIFRLRPQIRDSNYHSVMNAKSFNYWPVNKFLIYLADANTESRKKDIREWLWKNFSEYDATETIRKLSSESSGMYRRVLNWMSTDVSEVHAASIIGAVILAAVRTWNLTHRNYAFVSHHIKVEKSCMNWIR
jgi:hypothetical protein